MDKLKPFEVGYDKKYTFQMGMISLADEEEISDRLLASMNDGKKDAQKEYEIYRESLDKFKVGPITALNGKGTKEIVVADEFKDRTAKNERIIRDAYSIFKSQLAPESRFLSQ